MNRIKRIFCESYTIYKYDDDDRYVKVTRWQMKEGTFLALLIAGAVAGLVAIVTIGTVVGVSIDRHFSQKSCEARAEQIGTDQYQWHDFTFFDYGCMNVSELGVTTENYGRILVEND